MEPFEEKKVNRPLEVLRTLKAQNWQFSKFPGGAVRVEPCSNVTTVLRSVYPFSHLLADSSCYLGILQEVLGQKCEQVKFSLTLIARKVQQNQRILFREYTKRVEADDYKCLVCDPAPLLQHRALFWSIIHDATA